MNRQYRMVKRSGKEKAPFPSPTFILALIVIIVVGFGFYRFANYLITDSNMFKLKQIRVMGNNYIDDNKILKLAGVKPGIQLFRINIDSVMQHILKNPYLQGVSVSSSLPSTLIISVQERKPVAYLIDKKVYMVDNSGIMLLKKPAMSADNLPLITGLSVQKLLKNRQPLLDALTLIQKVNEVNSNLFQFVSEIHITSGSPPCLYLINGGAQVELGDGELYQRIFLLSEFISNTAILNQLDQIKKIDLTFADRIVVTKKS